MPHEIAFHITDIVENSTRAGAGRVQVVLELRGDALKLTVTDDGCGMDAQTVRRAAEPRYTTRTAPRAGMGLTLLFESAERCAGHAAIHSEPGKGTEVTASFRLDHAECPPAGDLGMTFMELLTGVPGTDISVTFLHEDRRFDLSTVEIRSALDGIPAGHPKVAVQVREIVAVHLHHVFGGRL